MSTQIVWKIWLQRQERRQFFSKNWVWFLASLKCSKPKEILLRWVPLIRKRIIRILGNSKSYENHIQISHALICPIYRKFTKFQGSSLGITFLNLAGGTPVQRKTARKDIGTLVQLYLFVSVFRPSATKSGQPYGVTSVSSWRTPCPPPPPPTGWPPTTTPWHYAVTWSRDGW